MREQICTSYCRVQQRPVFLPNEPVKLLNDIKRHCGRKRIYL